MATPAVTFLALDKKGRTTLPEEVRAELGVDAGDFVLLERTAHGTYELVPASLIPRDQIWFHHPEMQARVAEAEASLAAGRSISTDSPGAALGLLDRLKAGRKRRR